ncbi:MAG: acyltransferase [Tepidisphaeraceae bacterium]
MAGKQMAGDLAINDSLAFRANAAEPTVRPVEPTGPTSPIGAQSIEFQDRPKPAQNLKYLEGLRGLAAIVVTLQHVYFHTLWGTNLTGWQAKFVIVLGWLFPGRSAVALFIVLSGYLLMRPVVREGAGQIPGGTWAYIRRRAKRILPPYYASLAFSIALILLIPPLRGPLSPEWVDAGPAFGNKNPALGAQDLAAHLLLVHNLSWNWASKIDPPMWTIATEWQIYFLFPLILLPVWRRLGSAGCIAVGLGIGLGFYFLTGKGHAAAPWLLGLFAMGAAAAAPPRDLPHRSAQMIGWLAAILLAISTVITFECAFGMLRFLTVDGIPGLWPYLWAFDIIVGASSACFLVFAAASKASDQPHFLVRWLSSRWLVHVGVASYSLYLIHDPILAVLKLGLDRMQLGPWTQFGAMLTVGGMIVGVATWLFHIIFERPFMTAARVRASES